MEGRPLFLLHGFHAEYRWIGDFRLDTVVQSLEQTLMHRFDADFFSKASVLLSENLNQDFVFFVHSEIYSKTDSNMRRFGYS